MSCTPWMPWLYMSSSGSWSGAYEAVGVVSSTMMGKTGAGEGLCRLE